MDADNKVVCVLTIRKEGEDSQAFTFTAKELQFFECKFNYFNSRGYFCDIYRLRSGGLTKI